MLDTGHITLCFQAEKNMSIDINASMKVNLNFGPGIFQEVYGTIFVSPVSSKWIGSLKKNKQNRSIIWVPFIAEHILLHGSSQAHKKVHGYSQYVKQDHGCSQARKRANDINKKGLGTTFCDMTELHFKQT